MSIGGGGGSADPPKPTEEEKALAERAAREWNDYIDRYIPLEDKAIELSSPKPGDIDRLRGEASATAALGLRGAHATAVNKNLQRGAGLGSAATATDLAEPSRVFGSAVGLGAAQAERAVKDRELAAKTKLTAFGRGLGDQSTLGLSRLGSDSTRARILEYKGDVEKDMQQTELLGTLAGVGASYGLQRLDDYMANKKKTAAATAASKNAYRSQWNDNMYTH